MIRVLIADDHDMVRAGMRALLEDSPDIAVVGEARTGQEAIDRSLQLQPDVVLMDIRMPVMDGIEATRRLATERGRVQVLVLTTFEVDELVYEALRAGASGYLLKDALAEDLGARRARRRRGDANSKFS